MESVAQKPKTRRQDKLDNVTGQLLVIGLVLAAFFLSAFFGRLFHGWARSFKVAVAGGILFSGMLIIGCGIIRGRSFIRNRQWKSYDPISLCFVGVLLVFHYVVRAGMIGTIQLSDGLDYYHALNKLVHNPAVLLTDPIGGGRLCGHFAHGYAFLCMIGEFMTPGTSYGFQWATVFMGMGAAGCLFGIFRALFPEKKSYTAFLAALVVSVQPMFLGLSTMCNLEYAICVFFIYVLYCFFKKKYILMVFWLLFLATAKETGTMMAAVFVFAHLFWLFAGRLREKGVKSIFVRQNVKWFVLAGVILAAMIPFAGWLLKQEVWSGISLADAIRFGGEGTMTFRIAPEHIKMKLAQMFVLNFSWIWAIIFLFGIGSLIFNRILRRRDEGKEERKERKKEKGEEGSGQTPARLGVAVICYLAYTAFLLFYQEARQPRYNMLSDVLFELITVAVVIRVFASVRTYVPLMAAMSALMFGEAFVTIDPVSAGLFTIVETNSFPMVFTLTFKSEKEKMESNAGDFAYYNYHYTFVDRALDKAFAAYSWEGHNMVLSASPNRETQFFVDEYTWDKENLRRGFDVFGNQERFCYIRYRNAFDVLDGDEWPDTAILFESPWCRGDLAGAVVKYSEFYRIEGPYEAKDGLAGSVIYYLLWRKDTEGEHENEENH